VDPVGGGAKVTAQARAWDWPAIVTLDDRKESFHLDRAVLDHWWEWCRSPGARRRARGDGPPASPLLAGLGEALGLPRSQFPDAASSGRRQA
jgi:hypothetical protein